MSASPDNLFARRIVLPSARALLGHFLLLAGLFASVPASTMESDRKQPINIIADSITIDDKKGFSRYIGNVVMTQGSLRITGDDVKVYLNGKRKLKRIIVIGKPATMQQKTDENQQLVKSRAEHMEYIIASNMLHLKNNAHIEHGANRFSGNSIQYNMKTSLIQAQKSKEGNERVNITILPEEDREKPKHDNQEITDQ